MLELPRLQELFQKRVFDDATPGESEELNNELEHASRMSVYAEAFSARIKDAMLECYPAIRAGLGQERFEALAWDYQRFVRPRSYDLGHAPYALPEFLETHPALEEFPMLADLARLERALSESFHADSHESLKKGDLSKWMRQNAASIFLVLQPHFRWLSSRWPLLRLWKDHNSARNDGLDLKAYESLSKPQAFFIYRASGFQLRLMPLEPLQGPFLQSLIEGRNLGEACARLEEQLSDESLLPDIASWLDKACEQELFSAKSGLSKELADPNELPAPTEL
jgi:hypothetical protein